MLVSPRVSEKSYKLSSKNTYVFDVPITANKAEVWAQVEAENKDVKIKDVRLLVAKGKKKAANKGKRARPGVAYRKDTKKAYVSVKEGKIEVAAFTEADNQVKAAEAERAKAEAKQVKADAKAAKVNTTAAKRTGRRGDR